MPVDPCMTEEVERNPSPAVRPGISRGAWRLAMAEGLVGVACRKRAA